MVVVEKIKESWKDYLKSGQLKQYNYDEILASKIRCGAKGFQSEREYPENVLTEAEIQRLHKRNPVLSSVGQYYMEKFSDLIFEYGYMMAIADKNGVLLSVMGNEDIRESLEKYGFIPGADWSEASMGTNAIGTALAVNKSLQFPCKVHFEKLRRKVTMSAALIHDTDGSVMGAVCMAGYLDEIRYNNPTVARVIATEMASKIRFDQAQKSLSFENAYKNIIIESITQGVLATDDRGVITHMNRHAEEILKIDKGYIGQNLKALLMPNNESLVRRYEVLSETTDRDVQLHLGSRKIRLMLSSRSIIDAQGIILGTVYIFNEIQRTQKIMSRYAGATARLTFDHLIGEDPAYVKTIELAKSAAKSDASILLLGESGVGKDVLAQAIHNASDRQGKPYVAINCGAIPKELIASELFGYSDGAFTGARKGGTAGKFEMADGGTLFLDEIGEMAPDLQVHLLRVLENREVVRVGGAEAIPVDVRIIAATNQNLQQAIREGVFRRDLYYRLNVITLNMPPLRERKGDIPLLIREFYKQYAGDGIEIPKDYETALVNHAWPGNVRELRNIIERTFSLSPDGIPRCEYLPEGFNRESGEKVAAAAPLAVTTVANTEKVMLEHAMIRNGGNISRVARELGVARTTVYRKLKKYGLVEA